ncbi:sulfotransferase [Filobacillus milosensis]|uniref:Sulfotransferase n=1 Tax=Filobacillus milosensis TaxID=94137 RepID=A0A4Y8IGL2_9BACI|nr:sulfotransferase [Filobacillus milosensis]TFB14171.1 sulfotransferase [Filobacillus milosensis]
MNIVIIGAARSGTNMLRDLLTNLNNIATWPCDEINYIWRYSNRSTEHDEFTISEVNDKNIDYINKQFEWVRKKYNVEHVVEKTCANSLRVEFVDSIVKDPKYVFIFRDPIDVIASADKRWKAELDIKYILDKARFIPFSDVPYYGSKYLLNRVQKLLNKEKRLSYWGPKYKGFEKDASSLNAVEISAKQWKKSVEKSAETLKQIPSSKYIAIEYNNFVKDPEKHLKSILDFLNLNYNESAIQGISENVSSKSIGKGYESLDDRERAIINDIVGDTYRKIKEDFIKV